MISREISNKIKLSIKHLPVLVLTGPRQSGKTTLVKELFPDLPYANLESLQQNEFATSDPIGFLNQFPDGCIIDEIQKVPKLISEIQVRTDENKKLKFILTGSENLLLSEKVSQSLAGRAALYSLLPFTISESSQNGSRSLNQQIIEGHYPRIVADRVPHTNWLNDYIATYIERDVRQVLNIENLEIFKKFLILLAGNTAQLINKESFSNALGISAQTIERWLSVLEATFIIKRLYPYTANIKKRLVKSPKIFFIDTGIACSLLGIHTIQQLESHPLRGNLFETLQFTEIYKYLLNSNLRNNFYFYRDHQGNEIDFLIENSSGLIPIEVKSSETFQSNFTKGFKSFDKMNISMSLPIIVTGTNENQLRSDFQILAWSNLANELKNRLNLNS